jgi:hypothetical protein
LPPCSERRAAARFELREHRLERGDQTRIERAPPDVRLAVPRHVREPHAVRGEHAREGMQQHAADAEAPRQRARVLSTRAAEHHQRVVAHVVAARDRDLADRLGHVRVRDLDEPDAICSRCTPRAQPRRERVERALDRRPRERERKRSSTSRPSASSRP